MMTAIRQTVISIFLIVAFTGIVQAQESKNENARTDLIVVGRKADWSPVSADVFAQNLISGEVRDGKTDSQGRAVFRNIEEGYYFIGFKSLRAGEAKTRKGVKYHEIRRGSNEVFFEIDGLPFMYEDHAPTIKAHYTDISKIKKLTPKEYETRVVHLERMIIYYQQAIEHLREVEAKVREKILSDVHPDLKARFEREIRDQTTAEGKSEAIFRTIRKVHKAAMEAANTGAPVNTQELLNELVKDTNKLTRLAVIYQTQYSWEEIEMTIKKCLEVNKVHGPEP
jgi:hypothetical protein